MATNQQYIDRALNENGFHEYGASADATDSADALDAFNDMMHGWKYSSKDFNWFTQDTLADTVPIPKWAEGAVITLLARRLCTVFNIMPSPQLVEDARDAAKLLSRTLIVQDMDNADMSHLPYGVAHHSRRDIENDT